jgi:hypothetical protein
MKFDPISRMNCPRITRMLPWPFAGKVDGRGRFRRPDRSVSSAIWGAIQRYSAEGVPRGLRLMAEAAIRRTCALEAVHRASVQRLKARSFGGRRRTGMKMPPHRGAEAQEESATQTLLERSASACTGLLTGDNVYPACKTPLSWVRTLQLNRRWSMRTFAKKEDQQFTGSHARPKRQPR